MTGRVEGIRERCEKPEQESHAPTDHALKLIQTLRAWVTEGRPVRHDPESDCGCALCLLEHVASVHRRALAALCRLREENRELRETVARQAQDGPYLEEEASDLDASGDIGRASEVMRGVAARLRASSPPSPQPEPAQKEETP